MRGDNVAYNSFLIEYRVVGLIRPFSPAPLSFLTSFLSCICLCYPYSSVSFSKSLFIPFRLVISTLLLLSIFRMLFWFCFHPSYFLVGYSSLLTIPIPYISQSIRFISNVCEHSSFFVDRLSPLPPHRVKK